jgi:hypothetical protein
MAQKLQGELTSFRKVQKQYLERLQTKSQPQLEPQPSSGTCVQRLCDLFQQQGTDVFLHAALPGDESEGADAAAQLAMLDQVCFLATLLGLVWSSLTVAALDP